MFKWLFGGGDVRHSNLTDDEIALIDEAHEAQSWERDGCGLTNIRAYANADAGTVEISGTDNDDSWQFLIEHSDHDRANDELLTYLNSTWQH